MPLLAVDLGHEAGTRFGQWESPTIQARFPGHEPAQGTEPQNPL